jgi:ketosteroid isomerase-like protein
VATASETTVRRFTDAVTRGDAEAAVRECHPEVRFFSVLASVEGRTFEGHDGIRDYFDSVAAAWDEWRVDLEEVREGPDGQVAMGMTMRVTGKGSGASLERRFGHVWRLRDGLLWECTTYDDPADAFEAAGLPHPGRT